MTKGSVTGRQSGKTASAARAVRAIVLGSVVSLTVGEGVAGQPERAEVWRDCTTRQGETILHLKMQKVVAGRQLELRLWGDGLKGSEMPREMTSGGNSREGDQ